MPNERENTVIAERWLEGFWGHSWTPRVVDDLAAPDVVLQFSLQMPRRGQKEVKRFLVGLRQTFHDFEFHRTADLVAESDYVVGHLQGGGTHVGAAFADFLLGYLPANSRRKVHLAGTTVLRITNGKIAEEKTRVMWVAQVPHVQNVAV
jgi:predicted ester cyclase